MKASAIESLFTGKSFPCEAITPESREYWNLLKECCRRTELLMGKLSPEDGKELETVQNKRQEAVQHEIQNAFAQGYSLGVRLTAEAFLINHVPK